MQRRPRAIKFVKCLLAAFHEATTDAGGKEAAVKVANAKAAVKVAKAISAPRTPG